jgi:IS30 family transposase
MTYQHLSQDERYQIHALLKAGHAISRIAEIIGRHKSTVSRELTRNVGLKGYRPQQAQRLAKIRGRNSRNARRVDAPEWMLAKKLLMDKWSPEQVASHVCMSHETIYLRIYADKHSGGSLWQHLRCQKKRRKRYGSGRERRGQIIGRRPISDRPRRVESRREIGHWELDTIIGKGQKQAIISMVERKSGYAVLAKVPRKTADRVGTAIITSLKPFAAIVKTLTYDNGKEFAEHSATDKALASVAYFADPYSSWQRGSNENLNGLVRQFIPKSRPLSTVSDKELAMIQDRLNNRPRKRLGYKTPLEVLTHEFHRVALCALI